MSREFRESAGRYMTATARSNRTCLRSTRTGRPKVFVGLRVCDRRDRKRRSAQKTVVILGLF